MVWQALHESGFMGAKGNVKDKVPAEVEWEPKQTLPNSVNPKGLKEETGIR